MLSISGATNKFKFTTKDEPGHIVLPKIMTSRAKGSAKIYKAIAEL